jgi:hypothetical protein
MGRSSGVELGDSVQTPNLVTNAAGRLPIAIIQLFYIYYNQSHSKQKLC